MKQRHQSHLRRQLFQQTPILQQRLERFWERVMSPNEKKKVNGRLKDKRGLLSFLYI